MNRPNFLLIMADQFRLTSLDGMGDGISTPNISRIMQRGMVFNRACCTSPLCTPSRASLATGQYPHRCGVVVHDAVLPPEVPTYYQHLRKAGYRVAMVGKSDLHKADPYCGLDGDLPSMYHYGFTDPMEIEGKFVSAIYGTNPDGSKRLNGPYQKYLEDKGYLETLSNEYKRRAFDKPLYYAAPSPLPEEDFQDTFIGRNACDFLETAENDVPWHLFVSFVGPHDPWDPPERKVNELADVTYPVVIYDNMKCKPEWVKRKALKQTKDMADEDVQNMKRHYAAAISVIVIDDWVGEMLDILIRRGLDHDTVIVFCADHGEMLGDHNLLTKHVMYEGSLRIPLAISCPWMEMRQDKPQLVELMDLAPTFMELAGLPYSKIDMDARSLLPLLKGKEDNVRTFQLSELINCHMIFDGRYKWIRNFNDTDELYDIERDLYELHNCIDKQADVLERMQSMIFRQ